MPVRSPAPVTLDQLIALNDEIAALTRAGVPLERGLQDLAGDMPGRLGRLAESLGERLASGEQLARAMEAAGDSFPPAYRAVVTAGLRGGRLSAALEGIATTMRRVAETRRVVIASLIYPLFVLAVAIAVIDFTVRKSGLVVMMTRDELNLTSPWWLRLLWAVGHQVVIWMPWLSLVLVVLLVWWFVRSGRAGVLRGGGRWGMSTIPRMLQAGRLATFADVLALLLDQRVPLDEALRLAAEASGNRRLASAGAELARQVHEGRPPDALPVGFPPLMGWLLVAGVPHDYLVKSLRGTAAFYRRRATRLANWLGVYLPIILSVGIGGAVTLFYVLLVLTPFYHLLYQISLPG